MNYMIQVNDPSQLVKLEQALGAFNLDIELVPYATGEYGSATHLGFVGDYYENRVRAEYPGVLPWSELSDETRAEFGSNMVGVVGYMFPGMTFDGSISGSLVVALYGGNLDGDSFMDLPSL